MEQPLNLASTGHRVINAVVDTATFLAFWLLTSFAAMFVATKIGVNLNEINEDEAIAVLGIGVVPIFWGYYILTEHFFGKTLGKILTGTRVVNKLGNRPTFGQIVGRTLARSIPFEYFSYLATPEGLHDQISGTRVVKNKKTTPNK